jgi:hypothetical protein
VEQHETPCTCDVCNALEKSGLQVFRLTWSTADEITDHNYFAFDRSQHDFERAVKSAKSKIDDLACTSEEVWMKVHDELKEHGFHFMWQYETGWLSVTEKPPEVRGFTFDIDAGYSEDGSITLFDEDDDMEDI